MTQEHVIITLGNYTAEQLNIIEESSITLFRGSQYNNDKTKCIMRYTGDIPELLKGLTSYTRDELLKVLKANTEWHLEEEED